jgi:predicted anti-sigma-YlaC factor YlaD
MNKMNCEDILIQKSALLDGEKADLSAEAINVHLETCENCRREIAQMENTVLLLERQERRGINADLWSAIEKRIPAQTTSETNWQPFILLGAFLVVYKLVEMLPERDFGLALKLVPFVLIAVLFGFLKENPFKINTELILEK